MRNKFLNKKSIIILSAVLIVVAFGTVTLVLLLNKSKNETTQIKEALPNTSSKITISEQSYRAPQKMAYIKDNSIFTSDFDGKNEALVMKGPNKSQKIISNHSFSADSTKVAYYEFENPQSSIFLANLKVFDTKSNESTVVTTITGFHLSLFPKALWNPNNSEFFYRDYSKTTAGKDQVYYKVFNVETKSTYTISTYTFNQSICSEKIDSSRIYSYKNLVFFSECNNLKSYDWDANTISQVGSLNQVIFYFPTNRAFIMQKYLPNAKGELTSENTAFEYVNTNSEEIKQIFDTTGDGKETLYENKISFNNEWQDSFQLSNRDLLAVSYESFNFQQSKKFTVVNSEGEKDNLMNTLIKNNNQYVSFFKWSLDGNYALVTIREDRASTTYLIGLETQKITKVSDNKDANDFIFIESK